jgi:L-galactose dehydrogenase
VKRLCAEAAAYCRSQGADIARLALQFSLSRPNVATTLVGAAKPEYIIENVRSMETPIDAELLSTIQTILKPVHNQTWPSGRPENSD